MLFRSDVNDYLAGEVIAAHPTRFAGFASVALQDPAGAAKELERAVTRLGLVGAMINGYTDVADARGGEYKITVVNYTSAPTEEATAVAEAAKVLRTKGTVKYDGVEHQNNMRSQRISLNLANGRFLLAETLMDRANHLFIMEADTPPGVPPPSQFQASLQVLDDAGVALRYKNPESTERVR